MIRATQLKNFQFIFFGKTETLDPDFDVDDGWIDEYFYTHDTIGGESIGAAVGFNFDNGLYHHYRAYHPLRELTPEERSKLADEWAAKQRAAEQKAREEYMLRPFRM